MAINIFQIVGQAACKGAIILEKTHKFLDRQIYDMFNIYALKQKGHRLVTSTIIV